MFGATFRGWAAFIFLCAAVAVGAAALSTPAYPADKPIQDRHPGMVEKAPAVPRPKPPAGIGPNCGSAQKIHKTLTEKYGERIQGAGVLNAKASLYVYVSAEGRWTTVVVHSNGRACIVATGKGFVFLSKPVAGQGA